MTQNLLDALRLSGWAPKLIDRRFSRRIDEVGQFSLRKVLSAGWLVARAAAALVCDRKAPFILFATTRPMSLAVDACIAVIARLLRVRVIAYVHTFGFGEMHGPLRGFARAVLGRADPVVVLGEAMSREVEGFAAPYLVIRNTVPPSDANGPRDKGLLFVSNLIPSKGVEDFLVAANELPGVDSTVIGAEVFTGQIDELRQRTGSHVDFRGPQPNSEVRRALSQHRVLVFPSSYPYEAQPLTLIEAMSAGTPCVAYDVGGVRELVGDSGAGVVVGKGDLHALMAAARDLLTDDAMWESYSEAARHAYDERHSQRAFRAAWEAVLDA